MVERRLDVYCLSNMGLHVLIDGHSILIDALNNRLCHMQVFHWIWHKRLFVAGRLMNVSI